MINKNQEGKYMFAKELKDLALTLYHDRDEWTYCQGGLGQLAESDKIRNLYEYFWLRPNRSKYMIYPYKEWIRYHKGQHCTDCNNMINMLLGYSDNHYSCWHFTQMPRWSGELKDAPAGAALMIIDAKGGCSHVGLSIGGGEFIDIPHYEETFRRGKIEGSLWTAAALIPDVIYECDKFKPYLIKSNWIVGDAIRAQDLGLMGRINGEWTRLEGFAFTPGFVTNTICQVALVYGFSTSYLRIEAESTGRFYAVMVPAKDPGDALRIQKELIEQGYQNTACVNI